MTVPVAQDNAAAPQTLEEFYPLKVPKAGNSSRFMRRKNAGNSGRSNVHAQYDWTTRVPDNGNEWRKFHVVPRLQPLCPLVWCFVEKGCKQKGF